MSIPILRWLLAGGVGLLVGGCVFMPKGATEERDRAAGVAKASNYDRPVEKRTLPELPTPATWQGLLRRAFYANGDLEARYFEWRAALHRIDIAAGYPNQNIDLGFDYLFDSARMKSFDRLTVSVAFDETLTFPTKVAKKGQIALADAKISGAKFVATKFELQRRVLTLYLDLVWQDEQIRIGSENLALLDMLRESARNRLAAGAAQQDFLKAQVAYRLAENDLKTLQAMREATAAQLNGLLSRPAQAAIDLGTSFPTARPIQADDAKLISIATDLNPELGALATSVRGRQNAIELARMAYIPDFSPGASLTGTASQVIGLGIMLPTTIPQIRAAVREARDNLASARAALRQAQNDKAALFVANLIALRSAERQTDLLDREIVPLTRQSLDAARQSYSAGTGTYLDLLDAQRTALDVRRAIAEAKIEREKRLAELEAIAGVDMETLKTSDATDAGK